jgi:outer membrane receptor protein involved in Fe transport
VQNSVGVQLRNDDISRVGLYRTVAKRRLGTVRQDAVLQTSLGAFGQNETEWTPWLRTLAGVRSDGYRFGVTAGEAANSGTKYATRVSPRAGVVLGPWKGTELYANIGRGFHSNDARGTTIAVEPLTGGPAEKVTPLARATGAEVGLRTVRLKGLQSTVALWTLGLESELLFVGDAGTTQAGRPSRRYGVEWANYYAPRPWLIVDGDLSVSRGRFTDSDPSGDRIPGAVETVATAGVAVDSLRQVFGSVRWRYFGPRPLLEVGSVRSAPTSLVNFEAGYRMSRSVRLALDVFNLLDARHSDVDSFYASRLPGEPIGGVDDVHFHATLPRTARLHLIVGF